MEYKMFYRNRLTLLRMLNNWSMQDLANMTGLSKQAISKFESGDLVPAHATVVGMAKIFEVEDDFFIKKELIIKLNGWKAEILNK